MLYYGMWKNKISKNHIFNKLQGKNKKYNEYTGG